MNELKSIVLPRFPAPLSQYLRHHPDSPMVRAHQHQKRLATEARLAVADLAYALSEREAGEQ